MEKKKEKLLNKFALIFFNFTVVTLVISGLMTYVSQMETYKSICRDNCRAGRIKYRTRLPLKF